LASERAIHWSHLAHRARFLSSCLICFSASKKDFRSSSEGRRAGVRWEEDATITGDSSMVPEGDPSVSAVGDSGTMIDGDSSVGRGVELMVYEI
jgi:hypothetical protein